MGDYKLFLGDPGSGAWTYPPENSSFTTDINLNIEELTDVFESQHHITQSDPRHLRAVDFSQNQPGLIEASVSFDHTQSGPTQASAGLDHTQSGPIQASTGLDHTHSGPTQANVDLDHTQSSPTQANVGAYHSQSGPTQASVGADHTQSGPIQASASLDHTQSDPIHANVHIDYTKPNLMKLKELEIIEKENSKMLESDKISKYLLDADGGVSGRLLISRGHPASGHSGNTQEGHMSGGHLASGHSGNTQEGHMSGGRRASGHSGNTQEGHMSGGHRASGHSKDTHERQGEGQLTIQQLLQYLNTNITEIRLYNITADPEERVNLAEIEEGVVVEMLYFLLEQMSRYVPADIKSDDPAGDPSNFNNIWTPGWCDP